MKKLIFIILIITVVTGCSDDFENVSGHIGDPETFRKKISELQDINIRNSPGETLLMEAVRKGSRDSVMILLEKGADILAKDNLGWTAYDKAVLADNPEITGILLEWNNIFAEKNIIADSVLHKAVTLNKAEALEVIIKRGVSPDYIIGGKPLLQYACNTGYSAIGSISLLLKKGADPDLADSDGRTPLFYVRDTKDGKIIRLLVRNGAHLNIVDNEKHTPLYYYAQYGNLEQVKVLLNLGCRPVEKLFVMVRGDKLVEKTLSEKLDYYNVRQAATRTYRKRSSSIEKVYTEEPVDILEYSKERDPELCAVLVKTGYK